MTVLGLSWKCAMFTLRDGVSVVAGWNGPPMSTGQFG